ncbi:MAG TPA: THUMP domain-containing protein, partial [Myxococcota bacterium]|nr:THUMP domain-containing protein [Myxococcota bacterium]
PVPRDPAPRTPASPASARADAPAGAVPRPRPPAARPPAFRPPDDGRDASATVPPPGDDGSPGAGTGERLAFFATAAKGTEGALRDELRELRLRRVRADRGGVHFEGSWADAWRACLHSRIALRVLHPLGTFDAVGGDGLYDAVRTLDWTPYLTPAHTLAVTAFCRDSALTHTNFIAQRTKDAIVDPLRDRLGARPSVDRKDPDVHVFVHLVRDRLTVYLDLAGESLHRRGYRANAMEAPLKETLAAAILRLAGWDPERPFVDPMCGSGTLAIEAAMRAARVAPGLLRRRMGFERWASFGDAHARILADLRARARDAQRPPPAPILAMDVDPQAVELARANARLAGVRIECRRQAIPDLALDGPAGLIATNPPYGQRLQADAALYPAIATALGRHPAWDVAVLAGDRAIERALPRPDRWQAVFNGDLECRLLLYAGRAAGVPGDAAPAGRGRGRRAG